MEYSTSIYPNFALWSISIAVKDETQDQILKYLTGPDGHFILQLKNGDGVISVIAIINVHFRHYSMQSDLISELKPYLYARKFVIDCKNKN